MDASWLWIPLFACLILTGIHAWLGIHVLSRGVIFVDLALAQIAALGAIVALAIGLEPGTGGSYFFALSFTMFGAAVLSLSRSHKGNIPQEAIIGIVYAVASAAGVVITSRVADVHGVEKIRAILVGRSIVWVSLSTVLRTAAVYAGIAVLHWIFHKQFLLISQREEEARERGMNLVLWDFLFYGSFGVVITSSVQIAGVLLVFCFLIVPGVLGAMWSARIPIRLIIGWTTGLCASFVGLLLSYDLPSGPVIVVVFGALLLCSTIAHRIVFADHRGRAVGQILMVAGASALMAVAILAPPWARWLGTPDGHAHAVHSVPAATTVAEIRTALSSQDPLVRERALARFASHPDDSLLPTLFAAFQRETDPDLKIHMAEAGLRRHAGQFLAPLVAFLDEVESPFYFAEGLHVISRFTAFDSTDPPAPEARAALRAWWKRNGSMLRWNETEHRFVPR